jgi:hypothetical protein
MATLKVVLMNISSDSLTCLFDIFPFGKICFFVLEGTEPAFNHDVVSPTAFSIHAWVARSMTAFLSKYGTTCACFRRFDKLGFGYIGLETKGAGERIRY